MSVDHLVVVQLPQHTSTSTQNHLGTQLPHHSIASLLDCRDTCLPSSLKCLVAQLPHHLIA